ncbi:hypothetical protein [Legionella waltersii]|uniref:Uncharacterized protein n=1 Tax=Legionella waltersii TaxID=66969 RepID=A0A0W1AKA4_9GAMM|nr:hypothetical protein [Legionella waltersii]KTD81761.1 hypothetical protein Lwal_1013 [Legionella waltersii]SNU97146.1 Uncharacterised protein [Legionella waltersii]
MALNYICYIRNGHLQIEDADAAGGPKSDATLYPSDSGYPQRVHFQHPGKHPYNQHSKEALAVAAHNAWSAASYSDVPYQKGGINVLHGHARNVSYARVQALVAPTEDLEPIVSALKM